MAIRYSGNIELRIQLVRMRGWNGKMGLFYKAHLRAPRYSGEGVLSPREAGVSGEPRSTEAYDAVARAFLDLARKRDKKLIDDNAVREKGLRGLLGLGRWEILRVQQAPCPVEEELETRRRARGRSHSRGRT